MVNKIYKAAVIGCGRIGVEVGNYAKNIQPATHAGAYKSHPRINLVGLADINKERLKIAACYFPGVSLFNSAEEMMRVVRPDIVSIATNPDSHPKLVRMAAKHKIKAIVCEKPIAKSLKEAEKMIKDCRIAESLLFINHQRRFDSLLQEWRNKIKKGIIGKILQGTGYYCNGLFNNGTHFIDLLRFFLGEVKWVGGLKNGKNVDALIGFKNGARVVLQSLSKNYDFFDLYLYGSRGRVVIKDLNCQIEHRRLINNIYYKNFHQLAPKPQFYGKPRSFMISMVDGVIKCLDGKEKPISAGEDGLAALKILFALKKSAENNGKQIKL